MCEKCEGREKEKINPLTIKLPPGMEGKPYFTPEEFGQIIGKSLKTVHNWRRAGSLKARQFSPRCWMIPLSELNCYLRGEMMDSNSVQAVGNINKEASV